MGNDIEQGFVEVLTLLGKTTKKDGSNYYCPLCDKGALSISAYKNSAKCHACNWFGNPVKMYADCLGIDYDDARDKLLEVLKQQPIKRWKTAATIEEARREIAEDIEFLAWVRMYIAFHDGHRNKLYYSKRCGVSQAVFTKVIKGQVEQTSYESWKQVIMALKREIDLEKFKRVLNSNSRFYEIAKATYRKENLYKFVRNDSKDE